MIEYTAIGAVLGAAFYFGGASQGVRRARLRCLGRFLYSVALGAVLWLPLTVVGAIVLVGMALLGVVEWIEASR